MLESTTYPGTTQRAAAADPGDVRPRRRRGLPPRDVARAHRPGPHRLHDPQHAEGRRRHHAGVHREGDGGVPRRAATSSCRCRRPTRPSCRSCSRTSSARSTSRFINEMAIMCDRMDIDIWEVVAAAATKPFGFMRFLPGPGLGGHCLPLDPFYLAWRAREFDYYTEFIELAGKVNENMPYFCMAKIARALNGVERSVRGSPRAGARPGLQGRHRRRARVAGREDHRAARGGRRDRLVPRSARAARTARPALRAARPTRRWPAATAR